MRAKVVVDASGQNGLLQNRFKLRVWDPVLNKGAIWTYWKGAYRDTGKDEGATMVHSDRRQARLVLVHPAARRHRSASASSAPFDYLFKGRGDAEQTYTEEVESCPAVKDADRRRHARDRLLRDQGLLLSPRSRSGDGWVLVGDAFGFLDPLYSSGVLLALRSGEMAADAIVEGSPRAMSRRSSWRSGGRRSTKASTACAAWSASTTTASASATSSATIPELRGTVTDLLIGDLFTDRVDKVWGPMESLYPPGKTPIPPWNESSRPGEDARPTSGSTS